MIKLLLLAVVPFMTEHRNVLPRTEVSTNFHGSVTGIVDNAYIQAHGGGGVNTNAVLDIVRDEIVPATNRLNQTLSDAIDTHVANTNNPHAVTAAQVGALPLVEDVNGQKTALTVGTDRQGDIGAHSVVFGDHSSATGSYSFANGEYAKAYGENSHADGYKTTASAFSSHAEGYETTASGYASHAEGNQTTASGEASHAEGNLTTASGFYSHAEGTFTRASGYASHAEGEETEADGDNSHASGGYAYATHDRSYVWGGVYSYGAGQTSKGEGTFCIYPFGGISGFYVGGQSLDRIIEAQTDAAISSATNGLASVESVSSALALKADKAAISATNTTFSNAVLAVGLNIDTNSVAVLNDIAETFGGFPIEGTATTVGGLLAALAAAAAWLKKNKVGSFASVGGASATVENGIAKLSEFFTESNSLLNGRLAYSRNATGLKDRAFNTLSFDGTEFNLSTALAAVTPTASGQPRDLIIVATATAATTISFTAGTIKGDKPTIDGSGTWLITLTEYASGVWYCRQIKMEDAA